MCKYLSMNKKERKILRGALQKTNAKTHKYIMNFIQQ